MHKLTRFGAGVLLLFGLGVVCNSLLPKAWAQIRAALVKNVDEPGRSPFQFSQSAYVAVNSPCGMNFCDFALPAVPAGKRLVLTDASVRISLPAGTAATVGDVRMFVWDSQKNAFAWIYGLPSPAGYAADTIRSNTRLYTLNERLRAYAEAGQTVFVTFHVSGGNLADNADQSVMVTGYYVDLAQ